MTTQSGNNLGQENTDPCEQLNELLPAYSLGATTHAETLVVESLMAECPEVAGELHEYIGLSTALLSQVDAVTPPAHLHSKLMSAIQADSTPEAPVQPDNVIQFPVRRIMIAVSMVAVSLLVLTNIYWMLEVNNLQDEHDTEMTVAQADLSTLITLVTDNTQQTHLSASTNPQDVFATVFWSSEQERALLYTENLPQLTKDQIYQLWLIDDSGIPLSAGTFAVHDNGQGMLIFNPPRALGDFNVLGISTEPKGGSEQPTTDPIAVGNL